MISPVETRFAHNDGFALAYQVLGEGPPDLIYLPGWVSNVEANWLAPDHGRFIERLSSFSRLIVADRRGIGCSDRFAPGDAAPIETQVDDLRILMRDAKSARSIVLGVQETAFTAMLAAATHPERFTKLILFGAAHTWQRTDETPWQPLDDYYEDLEAAFSGPSLTETAWGYIRDALPSYAGDPAAVRQMAMLLALTAGPAAGTSEVKMLREVNFRDLLPTIRVPTLILHRTEDPVESVESGRYLAEHIDGATLVELPGRDTLPWVGEVDPVLEEIERFVTGSTTGANPPTNRVLATVLFTDIVDSTKRAAHLGDRAFRDLVDRHHKIVRAELARHHGQEVDTAGDGFFSTFEGPAAAVECALAIRDAVRDLGIEIRAGVHTGEVETTRGGGIGGIAVHVGARVAAAAAPSEVLVSSTVRDIVAGSELSFEDAGEHELKGVPDRWRLYRVVG
jgi:class 3 adenylate cyclase